MIGFGGPVFLCRVPSRKRDRCAFCDGDIAALCDHKDPGSRRSCSARLCETHRTSVGPNLDVCPKHRKAEALQLGSLLHTLGRSDDL